MQYFTRLILLLIVIVGNIILLSSYIPYNRHLQANATSTSKTIPFIASVDTMKESRDTQTHPLSDITIAQDVNLSTSLHTTHITVDTNWDYEEYFRRWAKAIHTAGKHIWVRGHPNKWENNNQAMGIMTTKEYETYERNFILRNADVFASGDIFDPCSEPEQGHYWKSTYPVWNATTTIEYNRFLRDSTDVANTAFAEKGVTGVVTTIHSTNAWMARHRLEKETIAKMGVVTIDSYPDQYDTSVAKAVADRLNEIAAVHNAVHVPIILGEIGYSNKIQVSDQNQKDVLQAEFNAIRQLSYIAGANYWVSAGGPGHGGYTNIFTGSAGKWKLRPAALTLDSLFQSEGSQ